VSGQAHGWTALIVDAPNHQGAQGIKRRRISVEAVELRQLG